MRKFESDATLELSGARTLRVTLKSSNGEKVYHDLSPEEQERFLTALQTPDVPAQPEADVPPKGARKRSK
jgi:hypothetical protein